MATPEPTLTDVLHAVTLIADELASLRRVVPEELASMRRVMQDEFTGLRHRLDGLDRDVQGIARYIAGNDAE